MKKHFSFATLLVIATFLFLFSHLPQAKADFFNEDEGNYYLNVNVFGKYHVLGFQPAKAYGFDSSAYTVMGNRQTGMLWESGIRIDLNTKHTQLWLEPEIGVHFDVPEYLGIKMGFLYFPRDWFGIGIDHESKHNIVDNYFGRGEQLDGLLFKIRLLKGELGYENNLKLSLWGLGEYYFKGEKSPHVITDNTALYSSEDLNQTKWRAGYEGYAATRNFSLKAEAFAYSSGGQPESIRSKIELEILLAKWVSTSPWDRFSVGPFVEYNRNLADTDIYGKSNVSGGAQVKFYFHKPRETRPESRGPSWLKFRVPSTRTN